MRRKPSDHYAVTWYTRKGIEMPVNPINAAYCAMKILSWQEEAFSKYRTESVQEFRFALSE